MLWVEVSSGLHRTGLVALWKCIFNVCHKEKDDMAPGIDGEICKNPALEALHVIPQRLRSNTNRTR